MDVELHGAGLSAATKLEDWIDYAIRSDSTSSCPVRRPCSKNKTFGVSSTEWGALAHLIMRWHSEGSWAYLSGR